MGEEEEEEVEETEEETIVLRLSTVTLGMELGVSVSAS